MAESLEVVDTLTADEKFKFKCGEDIFELTNKHLKNIKYLKAMASYHASTSHSKENGNSSDVIVLDCVQIQPELMKVVLKYILNGRMRSLFTNLPEHSSPTELFSLLDYLLVKKPTSTTLQQWNEELKNTKTRRWKYGVESYSNRSLARDTAVEMCWTASEVVSDNPTQQNKLYNLILYIVSHPRTFYFKIRKFTLDWYLAHYKPSQKQINNLNEWMTHLPCIPLDVDSDSASSSGGSTTSEESFCYSDSD